MQLASCKLERICNPASFPPTFIQTSVLALAFKQNMRRSDIFPGGGSSLNLKNFPQKAALSNWSFAPDSQQDSFVDLKKLRHQKKQGSHF